MQASLFQIVQIGDADLPSPSYDKVENKDTTVAEVVRAARNEKRKYLECVHVAAVASLIAIGSPVICLSATAQEPITAPQNPVLQTPAQQADPSADSVTDFLVIQRAVAKYFAALDEYESGDLIHQSQVTEALDNACDAGWHVQARNTIVKKALADGSFLVKALSSPEGRKFMRRLARQPGAYSRLDHLITLSGGEQLIRDLIRLKDGDKLIEYLATTRGGRNMGRMMVATPHGVDLNKPTGRIYTETELLSELKKVWEAEKKADETAKKGRVQRSKVRNDK